MSGREVRGTTGGGELTSGVKVLNVVLSGRDLRDVAGGGPWTLEAGMLGGLIGRDGGGGGEADDDEGGARFQFGSQLVLEAGMLEYLSLVFTTLATPASLAFSALALSSATVKGINKIAATSRSVLTIDHLLRFLGTLRYFQQPPQEYTRGTTKSLADAQE